MRFCVTQPIFSYSFSSKADMFFLQILINKTNLVKPYLLCCENLNPLKWHPVKVWEQFLEQWKWAKEWRLMKAKNLSRPSWSKCLFALLNLPCTLASPFPTEGYWFCWSSSIIIHLFSQTVVQAITQSPFGVGTSSLDTICFSIRSFVFWGCCKFLVPYVPYDWSWSKKLCFWR